MMRFVGVAKINLKQYLVNMPLSSSDVDRKIIFEVLSLNDECTKCFQKNNITLVQLSIVQKVRLLDASLLNAAFTSRFPDV